MHVEGDGVGEAMVVEAATELEGVVGIRAATDLEVIIATGVDRTEELSSVVDRASLAGSAIAAIVFVA